ncbi:MAG: winged helix-turn-helix domain-containing protein, partial [Clostridia bacterium]
DLELLQDGKTLKIKNSKITLTKTEYAILKQLLLTPDKVVIKTKLVNLISEDTEDGDENSLKVHISNMRKKIRKITEIEYIEAVWGIGFKMKQN